MVTIVDPYFFHGHDFVGVLAPCTVHLSVRSLADLFDSFVVPYGSGHVGPLPHTHTRRNRYGTRRNRHGIVIVSIIVFTIRVFEFGGIYVQMIGRQRRSVLLLRMTIAELFVRIGLVWL